MFFVVDLFFLFFVFLHSSKLGITKPLSTEDPASLEEAKCSELEDTLRKFGLYESTSETRKREEVLGKLNQIIKKWIHDVCISQVSLQPMTTLW